MRRLRSKAALVLLSLLWPHAALAQKLPDLASTAGLLRHGVSFGVAGLVVSNAGLSDKIGRRVRQRDLGVTVMPYFALLPSYWFRRRVHALYCAVKALSLDDQTAEKSADAYAERTKDQHWSKDSRGRCWTAGFGMYGGFPLGYQANFAFDSLGTRERRSRPRGSFGAIWAPSPYVSLVVGMARIVVPEPRTMGGSTLRHGWAYTVGVGGTFEIATKALRPY